MAQTTMTLSTTSMGSLTDDDLVVITEELSLMARRKHHSRIHVDSLDAEHRRIFVRAIENILSTELAIFTYAQIIDGLPIADVAYDRRFPGLFGDHPIEEHEELCPGALDKARELCKDWSPDAFLFNPELIDAYQMATPGSRAFETRLIELVAVALHQFGAFVYELDLRLHQGDIESITDWELETNPNSISVARVLPRPTLFSHHAYLHEDIYPQGVADIVGYWTEDRILGGVVVFDRKTEFFGNSRAPLPNIYFHACRDHVTIRVFQLIDEQQRALLDFLLSESSEMPCSPLPILGDKQNRKRYDAHTAISESLIFRDIWERKPPTANDLSFYGRRPKEGIDYC